MNLNKSKSAQYVADYIIFNSSEPLTPLHLNKFVFFSHGWKLGLHSYPLVNEPIEAWKYGPVVPSVYHTFKKYQSEVITKDNHFDLEDNQLENLKNAIDSIFSTEEKNVMSDVMENYAEYTGEELIKITHKPNSPWDICYDPNAFFTKIPNDVIKEYYRKILNDDD